ncbi:MAG: HAD family hydrolase [Kiritimatiellae bacterium]|nr:HAD family hydrolase [Kiritimatiellia bacterium]
MMKCVFFDRDGIINRSPGPGYVELWEDFHVQDGFVEALKVADGLGYAAIMISNQQCVGKGIVTKEYLEGMHEKLQAHLMDVCGIKLLDMYYCPHLAEDGCVCRKPLPGMILAAAEKHGIDLDKSFMVGDREGDVVTGKAAGCKTVLVSEEVVETGADYQVVSMDDLAGVLERIL